MDEPIVKVHPPILVKSMFSSHHSYRVEVTPSVSGSSINHRYSDFVWLHKHLTFACPGVLIPKLPPKDGNFLTASKDVTFIKLRRKGLELFLQFIAWVPYLYNNYAVKAFFSSSGKAFSKEMSICDKKSEITHYEEFIKLFEEYNKKTTEKIKDAKLAAANQSSVDPTFVPSERHADVSSLIPTLKSLKEKIRDLPLLTLTREGGLDALVKAYKTLIHLEQKSDYAPKEGKSRDLTQFLTQWQSTVEGSEGHNFFGWFYFETNLTLAMQECEKIPKKLVEKAKFAAQNLTKAQNSKEDSKKVKRVEEATRKLEIYNSIAKIMADTITTEHLSRYWLAKAKLLKKELIDFVAKELLLAREAEDAIERTIPRLMKCSEFRVLSPETISFLQEAPTSPLASPMGKST
ncbi:hypothetical protein AAMO2058_001318700 [Amorphochlora amoebiformis]